MSSELQLDVRCLSCCGGDIWRTLTKERQAWCYLLVKLCDPCLSALCVLPWPKKCYINTLPFLFSKEGAEPPRQFSAHVYRGQTPGWIKMALGMAVGLGPATLC